MFKGGITTLTEQKYYRTVRSIPERQKDYEITFPNVVGYRIQHPQDDIRSDFSGVENYEFDGSRFPLETIMAIM